jgi:ATP-dependent helicase/nuclease subunit B
MLRLLLGKARSGKTAEVFRMIREDGKRDGHGRSLLIVPEQYSHEAERELCAACGDGMSLYAEVVSFSGLARHVMAEQGGQALQSMDTRGRLVCMAAALREIRSLLSVFASAAENVELQALLVKELEVLQTAAVDSETLAAAALDDDEPLRRKITELLLIREAYEGVLRRSGCIPEHPLAILARQLENSGFNEKDNVYLDGFIDFTGQEKAVLRALMKQQVTLTVCFTIDENAKESELFLLSVQAMNWLCETAEELGISVVKETIGAEKEQGALGFYTDRMFSFADARYPEPTDAIRLVEASDPFAACEVAAGEVLRTVREDGLRWRDIAIAIRGFEDYRLYLEECFRLYDIPLFTTRKDSMFDRPLPGMIHSAYELIRNGWETEDMLSYLQSGLCGLTDEETDLLSGYVFKWQLKESAWRSKTPWRQHPDGYGKVYTEDTNAELERIHTLRKRVGSPLLHLQERTEAADSARE